MTDLSIQQALFDGEQLRARSAGFAAAWEPLALKLIRGFGPLPANDPIPEALFTRPFGIAHVAVVRVRGLGAHFLILARELYAHLHDPFAIADRLAPDWTARGSLPDLAWPDELLPKRTIAQLDEVLKHGDGPFLLGAAQALVDGCKIVLERSAPAEASMRELWALLPASVRRGIWPATFAVRNDLHFDLLALPALAEGRLPGYLSEDQARDYPDSRYERHLQLAIETSDQPALDRLLSRKNTSEMIQLALIAIGICFAAGAIMKALAIFGAF